MKTSKATFLLAVTATATLALTGCSGGGAKPGAKGGGDGVLTMAVGGPTYPKNFNWYGANQNGTAPGLNFVYESPFEMDPNKPGHFIPKLAESYDMEDGGNTIVFHLRKGVKWSDGQEMTADDFVYTYGFVNGEACEDAKKCWAKKKPEATDKYTAKIFFNDAEYQQMASYAMYYPIYPAHIWKDRDRKTDINENPVGTGPFKVKDFAEQQVTYTLRDDYWGGQGKGVKELKIIPMGTIGGVQAQLGRGEVDLAEGSAPGVLKDFVALDKDKNHYSVYPGGGSQVITFNTTVKPFDDVHVRRALRAAVDVTSAADLSGVGFGVPSVVGLDTRLYKDTLLPEFKEPMKQDVEAAKKELAAGGWTVVNGALTKDGATYPLELRVDNGNATWMQLGQIYTDQWNKTLGLKVGWQPTPTQVFNKEATKGNYAMFGSGGVANGNYYQGYAQFSKGNFKPIGDDTIPGNYGRWQNEDMRKAVSEMSTVRPEDTEKLRPMIERIQKAVEADAPFIPAMTNTANILWSSRKWTGLPDPANAPYIPSAKELNASIDMVMNLSPSGK